MSGFELYDIQTGDIKFSSKDRLSKFLSEFNIAQGSGSVAVDGMEDGKTIAYAIASSNSNSSFLGMPSPTFQFDVPNKRVLWNNTTGASFAVVIVTY